MVTFAMMAVMLVIAAPSFIAYQRGAELTSTANALVASLTAARSEAMKRQVATFVMPIDNDWTKGWVAFVDVDGDLAQSAGDIAITEQASLPPTVSVDINVEAAGFNDTGKGLKYVMYNGAGFMRKMDGTFKPGSLDFVSVNGAKRRIIAEPAGRLRVCKPGIDAGCLDTTL